MNRFTRELRKRGYKIDNDFEYLPYNGLDHVEVHADLAEFWAFWYTLGLVRIHFGRNMMPDDVIYPDDGNPSF